MQVEHGVTITLGHPTSDRHDYTVFVSSNGAIRITNTLAGVMATIYTPDWLRVRDAVENALAEIERIRAATQEASDAT